MAVYAPIYKDTIWTYDTPFIQYRIESPQGNVILEGRADTRPDGTPPTIYVNRLCEPFLAQELNPVESGLTLQPAYREFYLYNDLNDALLETYGFLRMYSGDWAGEDKVLSDPIKRYISKDMIVPFTSYCGSGKDLPVDFTDVPFESVFPIISGSTSPTSGENPCGYYIRFNDFTGATCDITINANARTLTFYVSTNIPYQNFPMGTLIHTHTRTGVDAMYYNDDSLLYEYYDKPEGEEAFGHHTSYDYTNENPPRIEYKVLKNTSGKVKHYYEQFFVKPPLCTERILIYTLIIKQLP